MLPYSSRECYALPHIIPTSDTDWDTSVIDSTKAEVGSWFDTALYSSNFESWLPVKFSSQNVFWVEQPW